MNKISVVINTYNAERQLAEVLESVKNFDEVLICDMESTDSTLEIAARFGCRVVTFPKGDCVSAEPARTFAIQSAAHHWVLVLDADEIVPDALREYLYKVIASPDAPAGLWIPRKNYRMGRFMHSYYPDSQLRFFIKEGTVWPPYVHTMPKVQGRVERIPASRSDLAFIHNANDSVKMVLDKMNAYTENEVVKRAAKNYGVGALLWRPFFRFFRSYILKGGIRDGVPGFISAMLDGFYQFVAVAKIIEHRRKTK